MFVSLRGLLIFSIFFFPAFSAAAQGWHHLGNVQSVEKRNDGVELSDGTAKVRIMAFRDGIIRVRVAPTGTFPKDLSWAVIENADPPTINVKDAAGDVELNAGSVSVRIHKAPLLIKFMDAAGNVVLADDPSLPMAWDGARVHVWKTMPLDENYYGLGDKPGPLNRRERAFTMWNTDAFRWIESTDPLYKDIPFFLGLRDGKAYGVFFDNTYRSVFDFGKESEERFSFGAEGGEINYYFFAGPEPRKVVEEYTALTGRTPLPPLWSLGFQQSRYSYFPEARAREIVSTMRAKKIPCDTIYFDIDYQQGNAPFTVNRELFPHFEKMISDFKSQGIHTILITDLHIKKDPGHGYFPYDDGVKKDVFLKNPDGSTYVGIVWPGESVFPDFTLTRAREWWGTLYKDFVGMGVTGFWNDMNEPAIFLRTDKTMPLDTVHRLDDGTTLDHRAVHNFYGLENARATYEGLRKLQPNERPFVLTRAAYSGSQRYAATWTGDNTSTWNHLWMSTPQLLSLGISGYGLAGDDIGGFAGSPSPELLTRWFEVGAFNPIYRDHTEKGSNDQEPWVHGPEHEKIRKHYIEERYELLPYIYAQIEAMARTGIPLMRPVFLDYPAASDFYSENREFLFGDDFLVAPVFSDEVQPVEVHLPPGEWYEYGSSKKHKTGSDKIVYTPVLDSMPVYVRAGAIIPKQRVVQSTSEKPNGPLTLEIYPGDDCRGSLYQDDGHTYAYEKSEFLRINYVCQLSGNALSVSSSVVKNGFQPWWNSAKLIIFGAQSAPKEIRADSKPIALSSTHFDSGSGTVTFTLPDANKNWTVQIVY